MSKNIRIYSSLTFTTPWSLEKNIKFHFKTTITKPWFLRKRSRMPLRSLHHSDEQTTWSFILTLPSLHRDPSEKNKFWLLVRNNWCYVHYVGDSKSNICCLIPPLHSLHRDHAKEKEWLFYLLLLRSLRHDFDKNIILLLLLRSQNHHYDKKNIFHFKTYFYFTNIMRIKYCFDIVVVMILRKNELIFIPTLPLLHNSYENKTTWQLSGENYYSIFFLLQYFFPCCF